MPASPPPRPTPRVNAVESPKAATRTGFSGEPLAAVAASSDTGAALAASAVIRSYSAWAAEKSISDAGAGARIPLTAVTRITAVRKRATGMVTVRGTRRSWTGRSMRRNDTTAAARVSPRVIHGCSHVGSGDCSTASLRGQWKR